MAQRFMRQPGESDRAAYARLEAEYEVIWAAYSEIKATVDRAAEVKAAALRAEDNLIKIVAKWSETGFPQAVQQERRRPNCQMDRWRIGEWAAFFHNHFNELVTAVQIGEAGAAGAELIRLREQVATLQQALSAAQEEARARAAEAQDLRTKTATLQQLVEQRGQAAVPPGSQRHPASAVSPAAMPPDAASMDETTAEAAPLVLGETELRDCYGEYWGSASKETTDRVIGVLAAGQHFTILGVLQRFGLSTSNQRHREAFAVLKQGGFLDSFMPKSGLGHSIPVYSLTARGESLAGALGITVEHRLAQLLGWHGESQTVVVLKTMDVLEGWGYIVDLWPGTLCTPAGQQIRPDLIATHPEDGTIYVEVELHGYTGANDKKRLARFGKWQGNLDANGGTIYVACPQDRTLGEVQVEITRWIQDASQNGSLAKGRQVILMGTVVTKPGSEWRRIGLREVRR